jgi:tagatose 6-phosphate kinase
MILCIGTTPAAQRVMIFRTLVLDAVNRAVTTLDGAAGKSINVAKVLKVLGEDPLATGFLGGDRGDFVRTVLAAQGVGCEFVTVSARTRQCVTAIDESAGTQTELVEEGRPVEAADWERLSGILRRRVGASRAVVMSGTIAAGGPADLYAQGTRLARAAGILSVVDAQGAALLEALAAGPGLVKPNRAELAATVGRDLPDEPAVKAAMQEFGARGAQRVIVTDGKKPALAFDGRSFWKVLPPQVPARNPIGSGDAFAAGLVWRLVRGDELGEACRWGSAAGAANALTAMPGEVNRADVDRWVREVRVERL